MELNWPLRLRIAAVAAAGIVLLGILGWRFAGQAEPYEVMSLKNISLAGVAVIGAMAVLTGFAGFFIAWPYGKEIGVIAVPFGLTVWAIRSGSVANYIQLHGSVEQRLAFFSYLRWEGFFWLAIVLLGILGVQIGCSVSGKDGEDKKEVKKKSRKETKQEAVYLNAALGVLVCILISAVLIAILAQDIREYDAKLGSVAAQPAKGQIVFAVIVAFLAAGFAAKKIFDLHYIYPVCGAALLTLFSFILYAKESITAYLAENWGASFFANSLTSILPIQMVSFAVLGSICGYWLAVRYNYWRKCRI